MDINKNIKKNSIYLSYGFNKLQKHPIDETSSAASFLPWGFVCAKSSLGPWPNQHVTDGVHQQSGSKLTSITYSFFFVIWLHIFSRNSSANHFHWRPLNECLLYSSSWIWWGFPGMLFTLETHCLIEYRGRSCDFFSELLPGRSTCKQKKGASGWCSTNIRIGTFASSCLLRYQNMDSIFKTLFVGCGFF